MNSRNRLLCLGLTGVALVLCASHLHAWWSGGHRMETEAATAALPEEMPEFFRKATAELGEMAIEPDNWKSKATPFLRSTEQPEHFIDLELLDGAPLPKSRAEYARLVREKKLDPYRVGFLPYALQEGAERLTLAFREYRYRVEKKESTAGVEGRIVVYAGWLAHYCGDAGMPLHTTKNFDGLPIGEHHYSQKGIHARIDGYPEKHLAANELAADQMAEDLVDTWPAILKFIQASHDRVDQCYKLDKDGAFEAAPEKGRELMLACARASTKLTLDLWYSAWKNSAPRQARTK